MPLLVELILISTFSSKSPGVPPFQIRKVFGPTVLSGVLSPTMTPFSTRQNFGSPSQSWNSDGWGPPPKPPRPRPVGAGWPAAAAALASSACFAAAAARAAARAVAPGVRLLPSKMLSKPVRSSNATGGTIGPPRPRPPPTSRSTGSRWLLTLGCAGAGCAVACDALSLPRTSRRFPPLRRRSVSRPASSSSDLLFPRGFAPRTPRHALSRGRFAPLRSRGSLAALARVRCLRGASPLGLPDTRSRSPLRRLAPLAWLARCARSLSLRGASPLGLPDTLSRGASPSLRSRGSLAALARRSAGLRPSDSPTRALARASPPRSVRVARSLPLARLLRGASPLGLPDTLSRGAAPPPLRRVARSLRSLALRSPRGFAPRTPRHALSLGAPPPRSGRVARSLRSLADASPRGFAPRTPHTRSRGAPPSLRSRGSLAALARGASSPRGFAPRTPRHAHSRCHDPASASARSSTARPRRSLGVPRCGGWTFLLRRRIFCFVSRVARLTFRSVKRWFDRTFDYGRPVGDAPRLLDRLRATPDRMAAALEAVPARIRTYKPDGRWSVQEHAGHLLDLEELWASRLDDFEQGHPVLRPADLQNRRTHEARHNDRDVGSLIDAFRTARTAIVDRLERWSPDELARVSRHPRLDQPMSAVDLCFFVAEHDDHHLAAAAEIVAVRPRHARLCPRPRQCRGRRPATAARSCRRRYHPRPAPGKWSPREIIGHLIDRPRTTTSGSSGRRFRTTWCSPATTRTNGWPCSDTRRRAGKIC